MTDARPHDAKGRFARKTPSDGYTPTGPLGPPPQGDPLLQDSPGIRVAPPTPPTLTINELREIQHREPMLTPTYNDTMLLLLGEIRAELATIRAELVDLRIAQRTPETRPYTPRAYRDSVFGPG